MKRVYSIFLGTLTLWSASLALADSPGPSLNPYRAYPPSCLADPLPASPSGPFLSGRMTLPLFGAAGTEMVTVNLWRTPCNGGRSALLGSVVRDAPNAFAAPSPQFPAVVITQGAMSNQSARVVGEPNTVRSIYQPGAPFVGTQQFVFENYPTSVAAQFDYNAALTVAFVPTNSSLPTLTAQMPAYDLGQYANAFLPLPITGYMTGNWYDPAHSGEGVQTEIGEIPGTTSRYIVFAWYTYDNSGTAYWLFGSGGFNAGDRSASITLAYETGGSFAGVFSGSATPAAWGTVTVNFPDCNTMAFTYDANAGLPTGVPQGFGSKQWTRLTSINGLSCL